MSSLSTQPGKAVVACAGLLVAVVAGCSTSSAGSPAGSPAVPSSPGTAKKVSPIQTLVPRLSDSDERTLWEGQRKIIRSCMMTRGIDFTFPSWEASKGKQVQEERLSAAVSDKAAAFANPRWAKVHGYGFNAQALQVYRGQHLGPETGETLEPETNAALYGPKDGPSETINLGNGKGKLGFGTTGCFADAQRRLYGDLRRFEELNFTTSNLAADLHAQVVADPAVSEALTKWRSCMSSHGWAAFQQQEDAYARVFEAYYSGADDARRLEFSIAPADAQCTVSSGYGTAVPSAEATVAARARQSLNATILAFLEIRRHALAVATTVLSS
jgi:hypothetical protein